MADVEGKKPQCKVVTAVTVAQHLSKEVNADLAKLGRSPQLVGFLANDDPAARMYANWTKKTCSERCVFFFLFSHHHRRRHLPCFYLRSVGGIETPTKMTFFLLCFFISSQSSRTTKTPPPPQKKTPKL